MARWFAEDFVARRVEVEVAAPPRGRTFHLVPWRDVPVAPTQALCGRRVVRGWLVGRYPRHIRVCPRCARAYVFWALSRPVAR
jgi:hypothetical protein